MVKKGLTYSSKCQECFNWRKDNEDCDLDKIYLPNMSYALASFL